MVRFADCYLHSFEVNFTDFCSPDARLNVITQQWREGQITNWEYLIALNLISGRTYQDLMQYPVFPWILSDYESSTLDLNGIENYRNLAKPIAIQHSNNEEHYVNSYNVRHVPHSLEASLIYFHHFFSVSELVICIVGFPSTGTVPLWIALLKFGHRSAFPRACATVYSLFPPLPRQQFRFTRSHISFSADYMAVGKQRFHDGC